MQAEEGPAHLSISPTFSSYSSGSSSLAEIAARVVRELGEEPFQDADNYGWKSQGSVFHFQEKLSIVHPRESAEGAPRDDDDEFEFAVLCREPEASTISANEIFYNGQIRPVYPVFNTDLLLDKGSQIDTGLKKNKTTPAKRRSPLRKLMNEERETTSFSSSGADDLGGVPSDTYCVWSPNMEGTSSGRCNKRNSTESSNKWKLRDLLYNYSRSKSEREDGAVIWTPRNKKGDQPGDVSKEKVGRPGMGVATLTCSSSGCACAPAHKAHHGRNRAVKEVDTRRSYLPDR